MNLDITVSEFSGSTVVAVAGEVDVASAPELSMVLEGANCERRIVLDLRKVSFMDSTGLRTLLVAHGEAVEAGGSLVVVLDGGPVARLLDLTGLTGTFLLQDDIEDTNDSSPMAEGGHVVSR